MCHQTLTFEIWPHFRNAIQVGIVVDKVSVDFIQKSKIAHVAYHQIEFVQKGEAGLHNHLHGTGEDIDGKGINVVGQGTLHDVHAAA